MTENAIHYRQPIIGWASIILCNKHHIVVTAFFCGKFAHHKKMTDGTPYFGGLRLSLLDHSKRIAIKVFVSSMQPAIVGVEYLKSRRAWAVEEAAQAL